MGVDCVHDMQEQLKEASEKVQSLQATIVDLEAQMKISTTNMEWIMSRRTRDLDNRVTGLEAGVSGLSWWLSYVIELCKMIQWQLSQPPVPAPPADGKTPR